MARKNSFFKLHVKKVEHVFHASLMFFPIKKLSKTIRHEPHVSITKVGLSAPVKNKNSRLPHSKQKARPPTILESERPAGK